MFIQNPFIHNVGGVTTQYTQRVRLSCSTFRVQAFTLDVYSICPAQCSFAKYEYSHNGRMKGDVSYMWSNLGAEAALVLGGQ